MFPLICPSQTRLLTRESDQLRTGSSFSHINCMSVKKIRPYDASDSHRWMKFAGESQLGRTKLLFQHNFRLVCRAFSVIDTSGRNISSSDMAGVFGQTALEGYANRVVDESICASLLLWGVGYQILEISRQAANRLPGKCPSDPEVSIQGGEKIDESVTDAAYPTQTDAGSIGEVNTTDSKRAGKISPGESLGEKANAKNITDKPVKMAAKKVGSVVGAQVKGKLKESESNITAPLKKQKEATSEDKNSKQIKKEQTLVVTEPLLEITEDMTTEKPRKMPTKSFKTDRPGLKKAKTMKTEVPKSTTISSETVQKEAGKQSKASVNDKHSRKSAVAMVSAVVNENNTTSGVGQESTESPLMEAYIRWSNEFGITAETVPPETPSNQRQIKPASGMTNKARDRQRLRLVWIFILPFTLLLF
ncbi:unnamed protein product [Calicophoron daubneyi]|uniref:Uncharacterized protein n=1 Tax=Calicophoron daubneyi TaxID=300641 RepID=A0AAV2TZV5_CALDB